MVFLHSHGEETIGIFSIAEISSKYFKEENLLFALARYLGHNLGHKGNLQQLGREQEIKWLESSF